jgi:hypothetical protein
MRDNYKTTTNRRVYKWNRIDHLKLTSCPICSPHKGCNRMGGRNFSYSWKDQTRKSKQWRRHEKN